MTSTVRSVMALLLFSAAACDGGEGDASTTTGLGGTTANDDEVMTTIPVTSVSATTPTSAGTDDTTTDDTTTDDTDDGADTDADTDATVGTSSGGASTGSSTGDGSTSTGSTIDDDTSGGPQPLTVGWCNLQFPATIEATAATVTTAYSRVYIETLTDSTPGNDIDPNVVVEFGYGDDGSNPDGGGWSWVLGTGNPGWDGMAAGAPNNDEYQGDLQFAAAGTYDYAARVSADSGTTWVYCDLDGLVEGGYSSDQAGDATIE